MLSQLPFLLVSYAASSPLLTSLFDQPTQLLSYPLSLSLCPSFFFLYSFATFPSYLPCLPYPPTSPALRHCGLHSLSPDASGVHGIYSYLDKVSRFVINFPERPAAQEGRFNNPEAAGCRKYLSIGGQGAFVPRSVGTQRGEPGRDCILIMS